MFFSTVKTYTSLKENGSTFDFRFPGLPNFFLRIDFRRQILGHILPILSGVYTSNLEPILAGVFYVNTCFQERNGVEIEIFLFYFGPQYREPLYDPGGRRF